MKTDEQHDVFQRLHQLIESTPDVGAFLQGMTRQAAGTLSRASGEGIQCAVTLHQRNRAVLVAGTTDTALRLDGAEQSIGAGPCLEAADSASWVLVENTATDLRWPGHSRRLARAGILSILAVPLKLGENASAALNFFAPSSGTFTPAVVEEALVFSDMASQALGLSLRVALVEGRCAELKAEMEARTIIGLACGVVMGRNKCTRSEAYEFLLGASRAQGRDLRDVAMEITSGPCHGDAPNTYFED